MFTATKATLNCRTRMLSLHDLKSNLSNVCNRSYSGQRSVWSLQFKYYVIANHKLRQYSSDSPTAPPPSTSSPAKSSQKATPSKFTPPPPPKTASPDHKPSIYERIKPAHWTKSDKEDPGITEHMLVEAATSKSGIPMTFQEKMKEDTKTAWYGTIMLFGFIIVVVLTYTVWDELFSSDSPNNVYSDAHKLCNANNEIVDTLGYPVRCHGEETRRGWRRHILHQEFWEDGTKVMRMKFYLKGKFRGATVNLQKKANAKGRYTKYDYLVVDCDGYPPKRFVVNVDDA